MKQRIFLLMFIPILMLAVQLNDGATIWTQDKGFFTQYRQIGIRARNVDGDVVIWGKEPEFSTRNLIFDPYNHSLIANFDEFDLTLIEHLDATDIFLKSDLSSGWGTSSIVGNIVNTFSFHRRSSSSVLLLAATEAGVFQSIDGGDNWMGVRDTELSSNIFDAVVGPVHHTGTIFNFRYYASTADGVYRKGGMPFNPWQPLPPIIEEQDFEDVDTTIPGYLDSLPGGWIQTGTEDYYNYVRLDTVNCYSGAYSLLIHSSGLGGSNVAAQYELPDISNFVCTFQFRPNTHSGIIRIKNRLELKVAFSYGQMRYYTPAYGWVMIYNSGVNEGEFNELKFLVDFEDSSGVIITPSSIDTVKLYQAEDDTARVVFSSEDYGYGSQPYWIDDFSVQPLVYSLAPHPDSMNYVYAATREGIYFYDTVWNKSLDVQDEWLYLETDLEGNYLVAASPTSVYRSSNGGGTWDDISGSLPAINDIYVDTTGVVYAATDSFPYKYDGSWSQMNNGFLSHGVMNQVKLCEAITLISPDTIIVGNQNGIYVSVDGGANWFENNEGIDPYSIDSATIARVDAYLEDSVPSDPTTGLFELLTIKLGSIPDVDSDSLLHIVLLDIYEDGSDATDAYFDPVNEDTTGVEHSNEMEMIYVDIYFWENNEADTRNSITRSLTGMIHWNYDPDEEYWVRSGANGYAWYLVQFGDGNTVPGSIGVGSGYITVLDRNSLFTLYMFLYENYGGNGFIQDLIQSPYNGFEGLDSTLYANGYFTNHDTVFLDWERTCVFNDLSLIDIDYYPLTVNDNWDPEVFNELAGYRNNVMKAESLNLTTDSLFFNADDELAPYLRVISCSSTDTTSEFITLDSYNEAFISLDHEVVYLFPLLTQAGDYLIDTKSWSFLPPRDLEVIRDYRQDTVELIWEKPEVRKNSSRHLLHYDLYRSENDTVSFGFLTSVDTTFYIDNSVLNESTYYYYVEGVYENGTSGPSNMVCGHPTRFPSPLSFRGMGGDSVVTLFWSLPDANKKDFIRNLKCSSDKRGLIGFRLYRRLITDAYFTQIESLYVGTHYNDTLVMNDTTYVYGIRSIYESPEGMSPVMECSAHPYSGGPTTVFEYRPIITGDLWSVVSNFGSFGDPSSANPSFDWPGSVGNYYLYKGGVWLGTRMNGTSYVSSCFYDDELDPEGWIATGPEKSDFDIVSAYHDWGPSNSSNAIGIKVIQRALSWREGPAAHIIAYEFDVIYDQSQSDIGAPPVLDSFYLSIWFDADVSEADPTSCHYDDLVCYDGWTGWEWDTLIHCPSPSDDYTILQDTTLNTPDGIPDQVGLFGDDPNEWTILGDTQMVWRDMSFILDGDDPDEIGNDSTENGLSAGFIFASMLYAPESPYDSVWTDGTGNPCRLPRPTSHQWWNIESDPGSDDMQYDYMTAGHTMSFGYRFLPHPYDLGAGVFDYRFLLTHGPYSVADGDTLHFVLVTGIGQGLNGGVDEGYDRGYLQGARQLRDYALMMYYGGATHSDPYHPSSYREDIHWNYDDTGIEEKILKNNLSINNQIIVNGILSMELRLKERSEVNLRIYDKCGRMVKHIDESFSQGKRTLILPLHSLTSGVYFIRGKIEGKVALREKVVLIK